MPPGLLERLEVAKLRFGTADRKRTHRLLAALARTRLRDAQAVIRLHEALLFVCAYAPDAQARRQARAMLRTFSERIRTLTDLEPFEQPEISGIAGTAFSAVFTHEVARRLADLYPRSVSIDWDYLENPERMGPALARMLPMFREDWPVEAHAPIREWVDAAGGFPWLVRHTPDALYQAFELLIHWELAECDVARTHSFVPPRRVYYHTRPLLRRADVSLEREIHSPPLPTEQLSRAEGRAFLDFAVASSAARYRELYGFTYGDPARIVRADAGRGLEIYFWGIPPARRLPLRAYHDGMMFKNGVPTGYVEILSLFERAEVGFNLYYTFREGESAWIFARVLRLCRQLLGVECFSVDPYQLGWENPEGIESGAFWFYRKLGFRPVRAEAARLAALEERKIAAQPGYRTPARTLRRLAAGPAIYAETADWDAFSVRAIGLKYPFASLEALVRRFSARWPAGDRRAAEAVVRAKSAPDESRYLRLMQAHPRLRAAFLNQPETRSASGAPGR